MESFQIHFQNISLFAYFSRTLKRIYDYCLVGHYLLFTELYRTHKIHGSIEDGHCHRCH